MPQKWTSDDVEVVVRHWLSKSGFGLSGPLSNGQTGADIIATKGNRKLFIEAIGYKPKGPARSKDFYESFFRAISRIKDGASECVIAMPKQFGVGLPARARQYGDAWTRLGGAFPEISLWLVDTEEQTYEQHSWSEWLT